LVAIDAKKVFKRSHSYFTVTSWITGGDWGAYEAWAMGSAGGKNKTVFVPHKDMIDSITRDYPVLVSRYDR
jgi:hypothetical protein